MNCNKTAIIAFLIPIVCGSVALNFFLLRGELVSKTCAVAMGNENPGFVQALTESRRGR